MAGNKPTGTYLWRPPTDGVALHQKGNGVFASPGHFTLRQMHRRFPRAKGASYGHKKTRRCRVFDTVWKQELTLRELWTLTCFV